MEARTAIAGLPARLPAYDVAEARHAPVFQVGGLPDLRICAWRQAVPAA
jgi:hypothetical protein